MRDDPPPALAAAEFARRGGSRKPDAGCGDTADVRHGADVRATEARLAGSV